jgi:hypothetical protein
VSSVLSVVKKMKSYQITSLTEGENVEGRDSFPTNGVSQKVNFGGKFWCRVRNPAYSDFQRGVLGDSAMIFSLAPKNVLYPPPKFRTLKPFCDMIR